MQPWVEAVLDGSLLPRNLFWFCEICCPDARIQCSIACNGQSPYDSLNSWNWDPIDSAMLLLSTQARDETEWSWSLSELNLFFHRVSSGARSLDPSEFSSASDDCRIVGHFTNDVYSPNASVCWLNRGIQLSRRNGSANGMIFFWSYRDISTDTMTSHWECRKTTVSLRILGKGFVLRNMIALMFFWGLTSLRRNRSTGE
jgi:hypothetical protein